jgi:hypothetical protein
MKKRKKNGQRNYANFVERFLVFWVKLKATKKQGTSYKNYLNSKANATFKKHQNNIKSMV